MKLKFKKISPDATIPTKAYSTDAGFDLYTIQQESFADTTISPHMISTGICVEIPTGYFGILCARSSTYRKYGFILPHSLGIIDADFRGELLVPVINPYHSVYKDGQVHYRTCEIEKGARIAQLIVLKLPKMEAEEAQELSQTERGEGGFGSSGR